MDDLGVPPFKETPKYCIPELSEYQITTANSADFTAQLQSVAMIVRSLHFILKRTLVDWPGTFFCRHHITSNIDHTMPRFKTSDVADEETEFGSPSRHWMTLAEALWKRTLAGSNWGEHKRSQRQEPLDTYFRTCFLFHSESGGISFHIFPIWRIFFQRDFDCF